MRTIISLFFLLSSIFYLSIAFTLEFFSNGIPGSGFLPGITGITLVILTGYNFFKEIKNKNNEEPYEKRNLFDMVKLIVITALYIFFFNILGALLSTLLFIVIALVILNKNKWKQNVFVAVAVTLVVFIMFDYLLNTHLPKGILENII